MTRVYLIRHGTTNWNQGEIFRGRVDCRLNGVGRAEAQALAPHFEAIPVDRVYSSPLSRALETAHLLAARRGIPVLIDPAFMDMDFGEWQGLSLKEVEENILNSAALGWSGPRR